jgi:hypothetical protein
MEVGMARWPRLYHEQVARLFVRSLYWLRFAEVLETRANSCFLTITVGQEPARALPGLELTTERNEREWKM